MVGEMAELAQATLADLTDLQQLAMTTFRETFGQFNTEDDLQAYFVTAYHLDTLHQEIQDPNSLTYLLREKEQAIGYLKVNWGPSQTEQELNGFEIQRIYLF